MKVSKVIGICFVLVLVLPLAYGVLWHALPFLYYSAQSAMTKDESIIAATCKDAVWSVTTRDYAYWGEFGSLDIGALPAKLQHHVTLTGSVQKQEYISITSTEYEPNSQFGREKNSNDIKVQVTKSGAENPRNSIIIDEHLYAIMNTSGGSMDGDLILLPQTSTLPATKFDELAKCYQEHAAEISSLSHLKIAAFVRL